MAGLPQKIPGFYFDVEKNKYFKITSGGIGSTQKYDREHLKRKQTAKTLQDDVKNYETLKLQARNSITSALLLGGEYSERVDWLKRQYLTEPITRRNYRESRDIYQGLNIGSILPAMYYNILEGKGNFITVAEDGVVYKFHDKDSSAHRVRSIGGDFKQALPIKYANSSEIFGWILHLEGEHLLFDLKTMIIRLDMPPHLEVYDALSFPCQYSNWKMVCYTLHSKVYILVIDTNVPGRTLAKISLSLPKAIRTDVLCITGEHIQEGGRTAYDLFAGCRGGQIFRIWVDVGSPTAGRIKLNARIKFFCNLSKPILALRSMVNLSYIAASVVDAPSQKLYLLNSVAASDKPIVAMFRARFQNMSRHTEIFQESSDGKYIIYGSTLSNNKAGGLQVFSTNFETEGFIRPNEKEQIPNIYELANLDSLFTEFNVKQMIAATLYTSNALEATDLDIFESTQSGEPTRILCMHNDSAILQHNRLALLCRDNNDVGIVLRSFDLS